MQFADHLEEGPNTPAMSSYARGYRNAIESLKIALLEPEPFTVTSIVGPSSYPGQNPSVQ